MLNSMTTSRALALSCVAGLTLAGSASAAIDGPTAGAQTGTLTLILDNDLFYNLDRHYSNGAEAVWTTARDQVPDWTRRWARLVPFFAQNGHVRAVFTLGQNLYTPTDIQTPDPPLTDRPYAGWLHGSVGLINETNRARWVLARPA